MNEVQVHFRGQLNPRKLNEFRSITRTRGRIVHSIRDPLRLVVSGYVYHQYNVDGRFSKEINIIDFQKMPIKEGMELFANFAIKNWIHDMTEVYKHNLLGDDIFTVALEDFTQSS